MQAGSLLSNVPALIKNFWYGLPDDITKIDAVYERSDSHIIFFSGKWSKLPQQQLDFSVFSVTQCVNPTQYPVTEAVL